MLYSSTSKSYFLSANFHFLLLIQHNNKLNGMEWEYCSTEFYKEIKWEHFYFFPSSQASSLLRASPASTTWTYVCMYNKWVAGFTEKLSKTIMMTVVWSSLALLCSVTVVEVYEWMDEG